MNRKIMEVVNSEDNGLRSYRGYIDYELHRLQRVMEELRMK